MLVLSPFLHLSQNVLRRIDDFRTGVHVSQNVNQIIFVDPGADIVFTRLGGVIGLGDLVSTEVVEGLAERIRAARLD